MADRWEEYKEQLISFRTEYSLLFPDLHFFQGLRFAVLGATLPLAAGLFTFYRSAFPFVKIKSKTAVPSPAVSNEPYIALLVATLAVILFMAVYSVDLGIRNQTGALIMRGTTLEEALGSKNGAFTTLQNRTHLPIIFRISGIITIGFYFGLALSLYLLGRAFASILPSLP
jgi:hypothetical protein